MKKILIIAAISLMGMNGYAKTNWVAEALYCPRFISCPEVGKQGCIVYGEWPTKSSVWKNPPLPILDANHKLTNPGSRVVCLYVGSLKGATLNLVVWRHINGKLK